MREIADLTEPGTTRDDTYTGTIRRPSRGSVKAIARSLSEKYKAAGEFYPFWAGQLHNYKSLALFNQKITQYSAAARQGDQKEVEISIQHDPLPKTRQFAEEMGVKRSISQRKEVRIEVCLFLLYFFLVLYRGGQTAPTRDLGGVRCFFAGKRKAD